jgi:hypothetical protein
MTRKGHKVTMKLSEWAENEGINLRTAQRMHNRGTLPVPVFVTDTGRIMVHVTVEERETLTLEDMTDIVLGLRAQLNRIESKLDEVLSL